MSANPYRSHTCNDLRASHAGQTVRLAGWIHNKRDLGGVLFIDLRDHYGITQVVIPPTAAFQDAFAHLQKETVVSVEGNVRPRPGDTKNPNLATGDIELDVTSYQKLGGAESLPMNVFPEDHTPEETRLKYRFLDLRRTKVHANIMLRSKIIASIRRRMIELGFNEFQTPILTSSSPEGARDFLVPSRLYPGEFYALPQAPQQFKQLLMVSGFDRYFQIAPCFRDEDGRADRTPGEFYQVDVEMSFVTQEDVFQVVETLFHGVYSEFSTAAITATPFPRLAYKESMLRYGTDKPDLRIPLEITDLTDFFWESPIENFSKKTVRAITVKYQQSTSSLKKFTDTLIGEAMLLGARGLTYVQNKGHEIQYGGKPLGAWLISSDPAVPSQLIGGPLTKHFNEERLNKFLEICNAPPGAVVFLCADTDEKRAAKVMGAVRVKIAEHLDLVEKDAFKFTWIVDYPMYERNEETKDVEFSHNPFSMPQGGLEALEKQDPLTIVAYQYDLVCNGSEMLSGAIRNHIPEIMYKAFALAGHGQEVVDREFAGMINAFKYGAPPHGGFGSGIDRIVQLLAGETSIREVIAFPMAQNGRDLLMGAPCPVSDRQLRDVHLVVKKPTPKV